MSALGAALQLSGFLTVMGAAVVQVAANLTHCEYPGGGPYAFYCIGNLTVGVGDLLRPPAAAAVISFSAAAFAAWFWFNQRKRRKRALKALGNKAKARLVALARKSREAAQPRPVLRPVPGGVS